MPPFYKIRYISELSWLTDPKTVESCAEYVPSFLGQILLGDAKTSINLFWINCMPWKTCSRDNTIH